MNGCFVERPFEHVLVVVSHFNTTLTEKLACVGQPQRSASRNGIPGDCLRQDHRTATPEFDRQGDEYKITPGPTPGRGVPVEAPETELELTVVVPLKAVVPLPVPDLPGLPDPFHHLGRRHAEHQQPELPTPANLHQQLIHKLAFSLLMVHGADSIAAMIYEPMSRRAVIRFAVVGVVLAVAGLLLRLVSIGLAVGAFLLAVGLLGLAGYGVLDRLIDQRKRSRR